LTTVAVDFLLQPLNSRADTASVIMNFAGFIFLASEGSNNRTIINGLGRKIFAKIDPLLVANR